MSSETDNVELLRQICQKKTSDQNQHIRISLNAKFHLKQIMLSFWTKFAQKCICGPKQDKSTS